MKVILKNDECSIEYTKVDSVKETKEGIWIFHSNGKARFYTKSEFPKTEVIKDGKTKND